MKKTMLIVIDGYGEGPDYAYNAVTRSNTPFIDMLRKEYPKTLLRTEGNNVGLPNKSMGGSEVGHFTIGAGRIVFQSLEEINQSIKKKEFFKKKALKDLAAHCRKNNSKLHIMGMISDQGIHSHLDHLFTLLDFAKSEKLEKVYIHAITDGRDVPEKSAHIYIKKIQDYIKKNKIGTLGTLIGRYYAMDRDTNFDRTQKAYDLYISGKGVKEKDPIEAIKKDYKKGTETDYFINPIVLDENSMMEKDDGVIFFNYRSDRAKQLTDAITEKAFKGFKRSKTVFPKFVCFGPYSKTLPVLFPPNTVTKNLGEIVSAKGLKQLRIAETEKYPHVTFFFNSQVKKPYKGEKQIMIPSPKVPSYDLKPEMSAPEITEALVKELKKKSSDYSLVVLNFANGDLVGHSGDFKATVKAIETVDNCLEQIIPLALEKGYSIIVTADHGNAEYMRYENGESCPSHTLNPVFFVLVSKDKKKVKLKKSKGLGLKDIAPTVLDLLKISKPKEMKGESLIIHNSKK